MELLLENIGNIVLGIGFVAMFIGSKKFKKGKDIINALAVITDSISDGKITKEESAKIIASVKKVVLDFKK